MLYFSEHLSLCALEILVHLDSKFIKNDFYYIEAEVPNNLLTTLSNPDKILKGWNEITLTAATQHYGSDWIQSNKSLGLSVPSVIVPQERNILINPNHPDIKQLKINKTAPFIMDTRIK